MCFKSVLKVVTGVGKAIIGSSGKKSSQTAAATPTVVAGSSGGSSGGSSSGGVALSGSIAKATAYGGAGVMSRPVPQDQTFDRDNEAFQLKRDWEEIFDMFDEDF